MKPGQEALRQSSPATRTPTPTRHFFPQPVRKHVFVRECVVRPCVRACVCLRGVKQIESLDEACFSRCTCFHSVVRPNEGMTTVSIANLGEQGGHDRKPKKDRRQTHTREPDARARKTFFLEHGDLTHDFAGVKLAGVMLRCTIQRASPSRRGMLPCVRGNARESERNEAQRELGRKTEVEVEIETTKEARTKAASAARPPLLPLHSPK